MDVTPTYGNGVRSSRYMFMEIYVDSFNETIIEKTISSNSYVNNYTYYLLSAAPSTQHIIPVIDLLKKTKPDCRETILIITVRH